MATVEGHAFCAQCFPFTESWTLDRAESLSKDHLSQLQLVPAPSGVICRKTGHVMTQCFLLPAEVRMKIKDAQAEHPFAQDELQQLRALLVGEKVRFRETEPKGGIRGTSLTKIFCRRYGDAGDFTG